MLFCIVFCLVGQSYYKSSSSWERKTLNKVRWMKIPLHKRDSSREFVLRCEVCLCVIFFLSFCFVFSFLIQRLYSGDWTVARAIGFIGCRICQFYCRRFWSADPRNRRCCASWDPCTAPGDARMPRRPGLKIAKFRDSRACAGFFLIFYEQIAPH